MAALRTQPGFNIVDKYVNILPMMLVKFSCSFFKILSLKKKKKKERN